MKTPMLFWVGLGLALVAPATLAQLHPRAMRALSSHILVPQARPLVAPGAGNVQIIAVHVDVDVLEQVATTTLDIHLTNATHARLEAEMIVPVPDKAVLRGFTFQGVAP